MTAKTYWQMLKEAGSAWIDDKALRMGAALAYYSVFSMAPILLITIAIAGLVFGEQAARGEVLGQVRGVVGAQTANAVEDILMHAGRDGGGGWATAIGFLVLFFGASGVFVELQDSLNTIEKARIGNSVGDISGAVQEHVEAAGFSVVREFVGHGIGTRLHEEPQIPNYRSGGPNPRLREGMVLAIEPMVNCGKPETRVLSDKWTAVTADGSYSAHFEHCVAVTKQGPVILTQ